jgi:2-oxo-4-hydroxy-4-carboxy--5-ureidoimidazoline (OHCU) decarboxylase
MSRTPPSTPSPEPSLAGHAAAVEALDRAPAAQLPALLAGIYEHSPWVVERAAARRPFRTLAG